MKNYSSKRKNCSFEGLIISTDRRQLMDHECVVDRKIGIHREREKVEKWYQVLLKGTHLVLF